jgi:class 3 adenylate cyclase
MPLYLDVHHLPGASKDDLARAHMADMEAQAKHGVTYHKYWFNDECGKAFCLVDAPNAEAANAVHREAHGILADKIIPIDPELAESFLGGVGVNAAGAATLFGRDDAYDTGIRTILFTDIVGSTEVAQRHGDARAMKLISKHDSIVEEAVSANGGRIIKHIGDGIMASFLVPVSAIHSACQIQQSLAKLVSDEVGGSFQVRIGAATGEPIERGDDLFGSAVNLAARLCKEARPGSVLVTEDIALACADAGMTFTDVSPVRLRGFDEEIQTREVIITC